MKNSIKRNVLLILFATSLSLACLACPKSINAFWPFDNRNGQVKGEQTDQPQKNGGFSDFLKRILGGKKDNPNNIDVGNTGIGITGVVGNRLNLNGQLDQAVKNGKITEDQKTEMLSRIEAIRVKQQELVTLEKSLNDWMKTNSIPASLLGGQKPPRPLASPTETITESEVEN